MKNFFLILLLTIPFFGTGQSLLDVKFEGSVSNLDLAKKEAGVTIAILQGSQTVASGTSGSNGRYSVKGKIDYNKPFDVVFTKGGFVSKRINFNFQGLNLEDLPPGDYKPIESLDMEVFSERPGVDFSFLNTQPVGKFTWSQQGYPAVDEASKKIMADKIDKLLKDSEQKAQQNEVAYNAAIQAADKAYAAKDYTTALTKYEEATKYKPKEQYPITKIDEIDALVQKQKEDKLKFQQENAAYVNLITAADNLFKAGDYEKAKEKYFEASDISDEQYPLDQIKEIGRRIKAKEDEAKYKQLIEAADIMVKQKSFRSARDNYAEALKLKPNEAYPQQKLKELDANIKSEEDAAAKKANYEKLVAEGEQLVKEEKWEEAKAKFEEALKIETASTYVKGQLDVINKKLADIKAEKEKAEKIAKLLQEGEQAYTAKTYDVALGKFKEVLTLDDKNTAAPAKIAEIEKILADEAKNKELNEKFAALVKQGDDASTAKKYADAVAKYTEAIGLKDDAAVKIKLQDAQKALADAEQATQKEAEFAKLIAEGASAYTAKDYPTSLAKYEAALQIKPTDDPTLKKISEIKKLIADQQSAAEKQQKIEQLLQEGTSLMEGGVMDGAQLEPAREKFTEVLSLDPNNVTAKTKIGEIDKLLKSQKDQADKEAKFKENVAKGDAEMTNQAWEKAIGFYNVAIGIMDDPAVRQKIADAQAKMGELAASKQLEADYQKAVTEANTLRDGKKYTEAIVKYELAKSLKPAEAFPQEEITKINQILADQKSAAEKQQQITALLAEGETAFGKKEYTNAKSKFEQVLVLDPPNATAKKRITDIEAELAKQAGEAEKQQQIAKLIQEGENLFSGTQYEASEDKFKQVLVLDATNATAKKYIADIAAKLAELKQQADAEQKFTALVSQGDAAVSSEKWQEAITAYTDALKIKADAGVEQKKASAQQKLGALSQEQEISAKYTAAITAANTFRDSGKYPEAIAKYQEAKSIKPAETYPQTEIDKINQLVAANSSKEKVTALLAEGQTALTAKDYTTAQSKYQEVLTIDNVNETAKAKLAEIATQLSALASEQAKEETFKQLKTQGFQAVSNQDYNNAMLNFEKALAIKDDAEIRSKINEITALRTAENQKSAQIEALLGKGKVAFDQKNWETATAAYTDVLSIDPGNTTAKSQLALIESEVAKTQNEAKNLADFNRLKAQGFAEAQAGEWVSAKHSLEEALKLKQDTEVTNKLEEVKKQISDKLQAEKLEQEYKSAMNKAEIAEAAADYEGALQGYKTANSLKPNEQLPKSKIDALSKLLADQKASSTLDKQYNDLIAKGDELVGVQDYSGAIKKYNEALALKPNEELPVVKARAAEKLAAEQQKTEQDAAFEKIIAAINTKITENDFKKAREYIASAASLKPTDPRPSMLLAKIESLEKENATYTDFMQKAAKEETAKNYSEAIALYEKAKSVKPGNPEPIAKIEQLRQLLAEATNVADKEVIYQQYFDAGVAKQAVQEYELAVNNYKNALNAKPNDTKAMNKIAEVEALIAKRDAANKLKQESEAAFNKLVAEADDYFNSKNYQKAAETYRQALAVRPEHQYTKKQLTEAERLNKRESDALANQQYQKILDVADNNFKNTNYEKALEYYKRALSIKSSDPYPKRRIEEINGLLNPVSESSSELQALGEPFDGSILDGEMALKKAEETRKDSKRSKVKKVEEEALVSHAQMTDNKKAEQAQTISTIYNLYTKVIIDEKDRGIDKVEVASKVHVAEARKSQVESENHLYEQHSVAQTKGILDGQIAKVNQDTEVSTKLQQENHIDVERVRVEEQDLTHSKSVNNHNENILVDETITSITNKIAADNTKSTEEQAEIALDVDKRRVEAENILTSKDASKYNESISSKQHVDNVYTSVNEKTVSSERELADHNKKIGVIDREITDRNTADSRNKHHESIGVKEGVTTIVQQVSEDDAKQEIKRVENTEKLKARANELVQSEQLKSDENALKNNETKTLVEAQDIKSQAVTERAGIAHRDKVNDMSRVEAATSTANAAMGLSDDQLRLNTQRDIDIKKDESRQRELLEGDRLKEKGEQVKETSKTLSTGNTSISNEKNQSILDAKKEIDKIDNAPVEKPIVPNALGEKYPEGVSQEMFQRKDDAGILSAIVTRRIVVIQGRGSEYVRTQTNHAITYTKNGKPITEYVWQKETQDAKLQRHY